MKRIIYTDKNRKIIGNICKKTAENRILYIYIRQDNGIIIKRPYEKYRIEEIN